MSGKGKKEKKNQEDVVGTDENNLESMFNIPREIEHCKPLPGPAGLTGGLILYSDGSKYRGEWLSRKRSSDPVDIPPAEDARGKRAGAKDKDGARRAKGTAGDQASAAAGDDASQAGATVTVPHGFGSFVSASGDAYSGSFSLGKPHGLGCVCLSRNDPSARADAAAGDSSAEGGGGGKDGGDSARGAPAAAGDETADPSGSLGAASDHATLVVKELIAREAPKRKGNRLPANENTTGGSNENTAGGANDNPAGAGDVGNATAAGGIGADAVSGDGWWTFRGRFLGGERSGFGELRLSDGTRYSGGFSSGLFSGRGKLSSSSAATTSSSLSSPSSLTTSISPRASQALAGKADKADKSEKKDGDAHARAREAGSFVHEGSFARGVPHGFGVRVEGSGAAAWEGEFTDGARSGEGRWVVRWEGATAVEMTPGPVAPGAAADKRRGGADDAHADARRRYDGPFDAGRGGRCGNGREVASDAHGSEEYTGPHTNGRRGGSGHGTLVRRPLSGEGALARCAVLSGPRRDIVRYSGPWEDGLPSGPQGEATFEDGSVYVGEWAAGLPHGRGELTAGDQGPTTRSWVSYSGQFEAGERHGRGTVLMRCGDEVTCDWARGARARVTASAEVAYASGHLYEGPLADGVREGRGRLTSPNGEVYEGEFSRNVFSGEGVYRYITGAVYEGLWARHVREGRGRLTYLTGDVVEAVFAAGEPDGDVVAVTTARDGCTYHLPFVRGAPDAERARAEPCTVTMPDGARYVGPLRATRLPESSSMFAFELAPAGGEAEDPAARLITGSGDVYTGPFESVAGRFLPAGETGQWVSAAGWTYTGAFARGGQPHGRGTLTTADGASFDAEWTSGSPSVASCPDAVLTSEDGTLYEGEARARRGPSSRSPSPSAPSGSTAGGAAVSSELHAVVDLSRYSSQERPFIAHGRGTERCPNGDSYEGEFVDGARSGRGTLEQVTGRVVSAEFKDGVAVSGTARAPDGAVFEGAFARDAEATPDGPGTLTAADGTLIRAEWVRGEIHGTGQITRPGENEPEEATWENGLRIGGGSDGGKGGAAQQQKL